MRSVVHTAATAATAHASIHQPTAPSIRRPAAYAVTTPVTARWTRFERRSAISAPWTTTSRINRSGIGPRNASISPFTPEFCTAIQTSAAIAVPAVPTRAHIGRSPAAKRSEIAVAVTMPASTPTRSRGPAASAPRSIQSDTVAAAAVVRRDVRFDRRGRLESSPERHLPFPERSRRSHRRGGGDDAVGGNGRPVACVVDGGELDVVGRGRGVARERHTVAEPQSLLDRVAQPCRLVVEVDVPSSLRLGGAIVRDHLAGTQRRWPVDRLLALARAATAEIRPRRRSWRRDPAPIRRAWAMRFGRPAAVGRMPAVRREWVRRRRRGGGATTRVPVSRPTSWRRRTTG